MAPLRQAVFVRHPLESYLSLRGNKWVHFSPDTLEEYSRRYIRFLDRYIGISQHRYEDFLANPQGVLAAICADLDLPVPQDFETLSSLFPLSGDSGRKGQSIAPRPRREVPEGIANERSASPTYAALCQRLGYDP